MDEPLIANLGDGLARLIQRFGWPLLRAQDIRAARNSDPQRRTFHLWFANGRELKGRYCFSARFGRAAARIREMANMEFLPAVIEHEDDAMLEQWIAGQTLAQGELHPDSIKECGRMLGRLHQFAAPSPAELDLKEMKVTEWEGMMTQGLGNLAAANVLTEAQSRRLEELARSHQPQNQTFGIVNRDMRPENIVADPAGRLFLVDNGLLTVGLVEEDLCRTWYLWPMTSDQRRSFSSGYRQFADPAGFENPSLFWRIVVVVNSAGFRLADSPAAAAAALARLDDVIAPGS